MKHFSIKKNPFCYNGAAIKKLLPNSSEYTKIDILIRESIQNSLDALKEDSQFLDFSLKYGNFRTKEFSSNLDDFEETINHRFNSELSSFIEIRDSNTKGLGGPIVFSDEDEVWGDFTKLVFSIANEQTGIGKGGSWGYGKTNYYTLGKGIVIFYTQTMFEGALQERLIIAMVEDTRNVNLMMYPSAKLGISYWGVDCINDYNIIPETDHQRISQFLSIFGLQPFAEGVTGTSIIIPFVDKQLLFEEVAEKMSNSSDLPIYSEERFSFFIELAVQRWYFPRLMNEDFGQFLRFELNGKLLSFDRILPFFKDLQSIYNDMNSNSSFINNDKSIVNNHNTNVMKYSHKKLDFKRYIDPYDYNIYQLLEYKLTSKGKLRPNAAIGFRCRSLGMINRYDFDDDFVSNVEDYGPSEFLVVGVKPISDVKIYDQLEPNEPLTTFEEYIRKGEDPTHTFWSDVKTEVFGGLPAAYKPQLIQGSLQRLRNIFEKKETRQEKISKRNLAISRKIGKLFLPNTGYGSHSTGTSPGGGSGGGSGGGGGSNLDPIVYSDPIRRNIGDKIHISFNLEFNSSNQEFTIYLSPYVDETSIKSIQDWENDCGLTYPTSIEKFKLIEINDQPLTGDISIDSDGSMILDNVQIKMFTRKSKVIALNVRRPLYVKKMLIELIFDQSLCVFKSNITIDEGVYSE